MKSLNKNNLSTNEIIINDRLIADYQGENGKISDIYCVRAGLIII
jgi:hypothetical protein